MRSALVGLPNQFLGKTRSGRDIRHYQTDSIDELQVLLAAFTTSDRLDAYALFQYLIARESQRDFPADEQINDYDFYGSAIYGMMNPKDREVAMAALSLVTIFDVIKHGKSRAHHVFTKSISRRSWPRSFTLCLRQTE